MEGLTQNHPILSVNDLHCRYNHREVLSGISFQLLPSDFLAIMGPNGAGKTTVLRAVTLSGPHVTGSILLNGKELRKFSRRQIARHFAVLPQNIQTPFSFTVEEILAMARHPHKSRFAGLSKRDKQVLEDSARKTDIVPFLQRKVSHLSSGERQRVFLAQALIQEPEILFLDEPISHLDLGHQMEIFRLLKAVNEDGVAVIAIFHDLTFAYHFAKHVLLLNHGHVHAYGEPSKVLTESNIREVFKADLQLIQPPDSDTPLLKYNL
jgi:iron complex transport system ATP-binding protein